MRLGLSSVKASSAGKNEQGIVWGRRSRYLRYRSFRLRAVQIASPRQNASFSLLPRPILQHRSVLTGNIKMASEMSLPATSENRKYQRLYQRVK